MSQKFSWTASFGRWSGVPLQIHLFFLLFIAVIFLVEWHYLEGHPGAVAGTALATVLIVFFSAVFHELTHVFAAVNLGGRVDELVVTPWGGESGIGMPLQPKSQLIVHAAGPFFNLMMFLLCGVLLTVSNQVEIWQLINPMDPRPLILGKVEISLLTITAWVNFQMFAVNMLPVFPFDASRIIRSAVLTYNPQTPQVRLESAIMSIGIGTGLVMFVFAWVLHDYNAEYIQPTWFVFVCAGIILIFAARYGFHREVNAVDDQMGILDDLVDYESIYDDYEEEETTDSFLNELEDDLVSDWLQEQHAKSENVERLVAKEEEKRVDAILEKLHQKGIEALSDEERAFLNRISMQYRRRRELRS